MKKEHSEIIVHQIAPLLARGELSLLLGAGYSAPNDGGHGKLPGGEGLRDLILNKVGKVPGPRTTLKDAYLVGKRALPDFDQFLSECFTVARALPWQERMFYYAWSRIYTTNIDNVLSVAYQQAKQRGKAGGDYVFFNYSDPNVISNTIGSIPIVSIHGSSERLADGFIFSGLEYALVTSKTLDWHRDLAAKALTGGLLVIGNQLEESDLDAYIATRELTYSGQARQIGNWIVLPNPDEIKKENYEASGYQVIEATGEEFFQALFAVVAPRSIGEIVINDVPVVKKAANNVRAMTWFKSSFNPVVTEIERGGEEKGILRHFITGADPDWFYIVNDAHAYISRMTDLTQVIGGVMQSNATGLGIMHVTGPSGSGKSTLVRAALRNIVNTYKYIYEFNGGGGIDTDLLRISVSKFTEKSIFVFYEASEYYYAISYMAQHFAGRENPYCLFILEDRTSEYMRNKAQLRYAHAVKAFELTELSTPDATAIAKKIEDSGLVFDKFSELPLQRRASIILDKERGYGGDLLSALFSLTTHENFEEKIYRDYSSVSTEAGRVVLDIVAITNSLGFNVPIHYVAGMLSVPVSEVVKAVSNDLAGVVVEKSGSLRCRHRIIANYYFNNCISGRGSVELITGVLDFLSRQFSVADIRHHPLPYRIYKELISFEFLYERYFPAKTRKKDAEKIYHEAQLLFGKDGIFWLQFGRYYRKVNDLDGAIDCFRTGLDYFDSYQTRHSLGVALIEKYIEDGCALPEAYKDGVEILDAERLRRGSGDPYPTTALVDLLSKVIKANPRLSDARLRIKDNLNYGIKYFSTDPYFREQLKRFVKGVDY
ncbi:SIR2 family protein [Pseudoxanthomonas winnipegensis]|uniref:Novel STAND NTPase 5 domain-containing protein n=1 Tax=Pseudoxanthomonas winnipegensis TaxID=2480810 RepID=A0A4Q8M3V8_9GAMM|nr:SIR2 family protein [Pseudoxanthomonas winnipegensis]TAA40120.1 hypothetical protein EA655_13250 [Pseudoxanthomonas winnipegensis]